VIDDYGYLNARVRGMSSHLLGVEVYPSLVESGGLEAFSNRLSEIPLYRRTIEKERASTAVLDVIAAEAAIQAAYVENVSKVRAISDGVPAGLIDLHLSRFDLHNVRTLIRGISGSQISSEIVSGTIPLGSFGQAEIDELVESESVRELISTLVTWGIPFGEILRITAKGRDLEENIAEFEAAIDGVWYPWAVESARSIKGGEDLVDVLAGEIDLRNIVNMLKLARQSVGFDLSAEMVIAGGNLADGQLAELAESSDLKSALDIVARTRYGVAISGIESASTRQVTGVEGEVERLLMRNFSKLFRKDPLGFSTILGYLWRRHAEYVDLRLIAHGIAFGLPMAGVRSQLVNS
jgi:V/A-type H+-transporting ATPase subunit C